MDKAKADVTAADKELNAELVELTPNSNARLRSLRSIASDWNKAGRATAIRWLHPHNDLPNHYSKNQINYLHCLKNATFVTPLPNAEATGRNRLISVQKRCAEFKEMT